MNFDLYDVQLLKVGPPRLGKGGESDEPFGQGGGGITQVLRKGSLCLTWLFLPPITHFFPLSLFSSLLLKGSSGWKLDEGRGEIRGKGAEGNVGVKGLVGPQVDAQIIHVG